MDIRLVRLAAADLDATWIGREMILDNLCGALSDVECAASGRVVALYLAGTAGTRGAVDDRRLRHARCGVLMRNTVRAVSPNQPKTPMRAVRVDDETWDAIRGLAGRLGITVSDVVREALRLRLEAGD